MPVGSESLKPATPTNTALPADPRVLAIDDGEDSADGMASVGGSGGGKAATVARFSMNEWARLIHVMADPAYSRYVEAAEGRARWRQLDDPADSRRDEWSAEGALATAFNQTREPKYAAIRTDDEGTPIAAFAAIDPEDRCVYRSAEYLKARWRDLKAAFTTAYQRYSRSGQNDPSGFHKFIPSSASSAERTRVLYMHYVFRDAPNLEAVVKTVGKMAREEGLDVDGEDDEGAAPVAGTKRHRSGRTHAASRAEEVADPIVTMGTVHSAATEAAAWAAAEQAKAATKLIMEEETNTQLERLKMLRALKREFVADGEDEATVAAVDAQINELKGALFKPKEAQ